VYAVDGFSSDCVVLGALGIFNERKVLPDLVISGINGGANEGPSWFGSGTVGAARTAAFMGIPAIAVYSIHKSDTNAGKSVSTWVADFIKTDMVRKVKHFEYFTVSVPRDLEKIKGANVVERDVSIINSIRACLVRENKSETKAGQKDYWTISFKRKASNEINHKRALYYYMKNYIVIIPMTIDENNYRILKEKDSLETQLPAFKILKSLSLEKH
jgi:5'-nucleotidase